MEKIKLLVLTEHGAHSNANSIYPLLRRMRNHCGCARIDLASRSLPWNAGFFRGEDRGHLWVTTVTNRFRYTRDGRYFNAPIRRVDPADYQAILVRLPHPTLDAFWDFLETHFDQAVIINHPAGIRETSNKAYLLQFPELCPPMQLCQCISDIEALRADYPIVLKPLHNYGGKGVVRIEVDTVWVGNQRTTFRSFVQHLGEAPIEYLAMRYLPGVAEGDKRIIVCNGEVMGASLRVPAPGSWLCNAAQGGSAVAADLMEEERSMVDRLAPVMAAKGIVLFGLDTLKDDNGQRILSEINTMSLGGLIQTERLNGLPVVQRIADALWRHINLNVYGKLSHSA